MQFHYADEKWDEFFSEIASYIIFLNCILLQINHEILILKYT